jgi:hypothetical protein
MTRPARRVLALLISATAALCLTGVAPQAFAAPGDASAYGWYVKLHGTGLPTGQYNHPPGPVAVVSQGGAAEQSAYGEDFEPAGSVAFGAAGGDTRRDGNAGATAAARGVLLFEGTPAELRLDEVSAHCASSHAGRSSLSKGLLGGKPLPQRPKPNTRIMVMSPASELPIGVLMLNEQIHNGDGSLTVQGASYVVNIPASIGGVGSPETDTYAKGEIILGSATCGAS